MALDDDDDVRLQLQVWGYAVTGDVTEISALVAESRFEDVGAYDPRNVWDRRREDIVNSVVKVGNRLRVVPDWWCLRWLSNPQRERALDQMHEIRTTRRGRM